jgi:hypothetical protein
MTTPAPTKDPVKYANELLKRQQKQKEYLKEKAIQNEQLARAMYQEYIRRKNASGEPRILRQADFRQNRRWRPENEGYVPAEEFNPTEENLAAMKGIKGAVYKTSKKVSEVRNKLGKSVAGLIDTYGPNLTESNNESNSENTEPNMNKFTTAAKGLRNIIKGTKKGLRATRNYLSREPTRYTKNGKPIVTKNEVIKRYIEEHGYDPTTLNTPTTSTNDYSRYLLPSTSTYDYSMYPWLTSTQLNTSAPSWINTSTTNPWGAELKYESLEKNPWVTPLELSPPPPAPSKPELPAAPTSSLFKKGFLKGKVLGKGGYSRQQTRKISHATRKASSKKNCYTRRR